MKRLSLSVLSALSLLLLLSAAPALAQKADSPRWGIVLAAFGSTSPQAMAAVDKVKARFEAAFPGVPVAVGLTSRHAVGVLKAPGVLSAMGSLADQGCRRLYVQPLHVSAGAEYDDLDALARALNALAGAGVNKPPFEAVVLGAPALGRSRDGDPDALAEAARALAGDAELARSRVAALVYGAHGNPKRPEAREFAAFQDAMHRSYPGVVVLAGTVESKPGLEEVMAGLEKTGTRKVVLFPLLFGAGVHAAEDLCGDGPESWRTALEKAGYQVDCRMRGLGDADAFADMLVARARRAMAEGGAP